MTVTGAGFNAAGVTAVNFGTVPGSGLPVVSDTERESLPADELAESTDVPEESEGRSFVEPQERPAVGRGGAGRRERGRITMLVILADRHDWTSRRLAADWGAHAKLLSCPDHRRSRRGVVRERGR